jgi:hypothetical protein
MTITEALSAVMNDVQAVAKKDRNTHQNFNFRGIDAVVNAVGPALRKHGVVVVPEVQDVTYEKVSTTNNKPATACRLVVSYTFHKDDSYLSCTVAAEAWDHGDKAAPKAMSVAFRTALLQALALPTDEPDPDTHTYEQEPVDVSALDELIDAATDAGVSKTKKEWDKLRDWARQSEEHLTKACDKVSRAMDEAAA